MLRTNSSSLQPDRHLVLPSPLAGPPLGRSSADCAELSLSLVAEIYLGVNLCYQRQSADCWNLRGNEERDESRQAERPRAGW